MTKQKILVIGTGGTIGAKAGSTITANAPLKILNLYTPPAGVDLIGRAAFDRFSEHADLAYLEQLCTYMQGIDYSAYRGVVLLHGSDTLTYTAALLAHLLPDKPLVLVAAGTPPEAPGSNALPNLDLAVHYLLSGAKDGVQIAYDGLHPAWATTEADCNDRFHHASVPFVPVQAPAFHRRRILQITPHPGIDYGVFDLTGVDAVLHRMYHSATVPEPATAFADRCKEAGVPCLFVTPKPAVAYVTAAHLPGVWTSTTPESAFAKLLLTNGQDFDTMTLQVNENR